MAVQTGVTLWASVAVAGATRDIEYRGGDYRVSFLYFSGEPSYFHSGSGEGSAGADEEIELLCVLDEEGNDILWTLSLREQREIENILLEE